MLYCFEVMQIGIAQVDEIFFLWKMITKTETQIFRFIMWITQDFTQNLLSPDIPAI